MSDPRVPADIAALLSAFHGVGGYALGARIGEGAMGAVYLARRPEDTASVVALKLVHPHLASDPAMRALFLHEATLAQRIEHPNVCRVVDFGEAQGTCFLAMEHLRGQTLAAVVARTGPALPLGLAARIVSDAARGLHAAHELRLASGAPAGVVHRDVSPSNLFVCDDGRTAVLDFGVARSDEPSRALTGPGETRGKPGYMSPEQCRGDLADRRSDVFALGIVLWELIAGRRLYQFKTRLHAIAGVLTTRVVTPRTHRPECSEALAAVAMRCLAHDVDARFESAAVFADALLAAAAPAPGAEAVASWVHGAFASERAWMDAQVTACRAAGGG